jgi:hypothetical protein
MADDRPVVRMISALVRWPVHGELVEQDWPLVANEHRSSDQLKEWGAATPSANIHSVFIQILHLAIFILRGLYTSFPRVQLSAKPLG